MCWRPKLEVSSYNLRAEKELVGIGFSMKSDTGVSVFLIGQETERVYLLEIDDRMMQRAAFDSHADIVAALSSIVDVALESIFYYRIGEPIVLWMAVPLPRPLSQLMSAAN